MTHAARQPDLAPSVSPGATPGTARLLRAPWLGVFSPRRVTHDVASADVFALVIAMLPVAILYCGGSVLIEAWSETVQHGPGWNATGPNAPINATPGPAVIERSLAAVWAAWGQTKDIHPALSWALSSTGWALVLFLLLTILLLPHAHRHAETIETVQRAIRSVVIASGMFCAAGLAMSALDVICAHYWIRIGTVHPDRYWLYHILTTLSNLPIWLPVLACAATAKSLRGDDGVNDLTLRCERCGYDLTHIPADQNCPECGGDLRLSLMAGAVRSPARWERDGNRFAAWWRTGLEVLLSPLRFYGHLAVRTDSTRVRQFMRYNLVAITIASAIWQAVVDRYAGRDWPATAASILDTLSLGVLLWLVILNLAAGLSLITWMLRGTMPDTTRVRRIAAYESTWLWVFPLFNGLLGTSLYVWSNWLQDLATHLGISRRLPTDIDTCVFLGGNFLLFAAGLVRFEIAARCVRWSNF